jgi:hypothetical protein
LEKKKKLVGGKKKEKDKTQQHRQGLMLGLADLMPDCLLEVSFHLEGPVTGQLSQGFPWVSSVPEEMLSWYPNSTLHCSLPNSNIKISPYTNVTLTFHFELDHPVHGG